MRYNYNDLNKTCIDIDFFLHIITVININRITNNLFSMNPKSPQARNVQEDPFKGMEIADISPLRMLTGRSPCPKCGKSRMYFCYTCYVPVSLIEDHIPICKLPIKVDIIKHPKEIDGKSTAAHAAVLAPADVNIFIYPDIGENYLDGRTVLLYPGIEAKSVKDLFSEYNNTKSYSDQILAELPSGYNVGTLMTKIVNGDNGSKEIYHVNKLPIDRVVLIDSTWNQSRSIFKDERIKEIPKIVLQNRPSHFWRHQKGSPRWYLSTIEALHQLMLELHLFAWGCSENYNSNFTLHYPVHDSFHSHLQCTPYTGQYDNLLYFFKYLYEKLHTLYSHEDLLAYKRTMF